MTLVIRHRLALLRPKKPNNVGVTTLPSMDDVWTCIYTYIGCIVVNRGMVERTSVDEQRAFAGR
ncbi:hypothetical protein PISMIDRAFT_680816 [Pisolithus microcarpus 441]|uniref:Uncharacterized protein n=1 Tax=Pisolithus microcarpus 441 TaxID=765257 RepID=A0A0C9YBF0_9AGAM|nr:hypothetical protein PISMIDRAFT_680816 [Pisolithus microcarpus 441]